MTKRRQFWVENFIEMFSSERSRRHGTFKLKRQTSGCFYQGLNVMINYLSDEFRVSKFTFAFYKTNKPKKKRIRINISKVP